MGYTHYWSLKNSNISQKNFNKVVKDLKKIEKHFEDEALLFNGNGTEQGVYYGGGEIKGKFECTEFMFNGNSADDFDHETMSLYVGENNWSFCKTARKPYDIAVCLILLSMKYHTRSTNISSDGENEDWKDAFKLWTEIFGRGVTFKFKEWVTDSKTLDGSLSVIKVTEKISA